MTAAIIPFARPQRHADDQIPPPFVVHWSPLSSAHFIGTCEQLIAWGIVVEDDFPVKPKRLHFNCEKYPGAFVQVKALRRGLFDAHCHAHGSGQDSMRYGVWLDSTCRKILGSDPMIAATSRLLLDMHEWRRQTFFGHYDEALFAVRERHDDALQSSRNAFERAAIEAVMDLKLTKDAERLAGGGS